MRISAGVIAVVVVLCSSEADVAAEADLSPVRLTADAGLDAMPGWSPDGRRIVFHSRRTPAKEGLLPTRKIWVMERDGTDARKLSDGAGDEYHPVFSPDGSKIAFVSESAGSRDVWLMGADGSNPIPLTDDPGLEEHPAWSPDGRRIAYAALPPEGGNLDLWVMNDDGSGKRKLTFSAANEIFPAWHPDGGTLAFTSDSSGSFGIFAMDLENERISMLVDGPDHETRPAWSPDGTRLAFTRWPADGLGTESVLVIANADGTAPLELPVPRPSVHPAWSPDGAELAFQHEREANWDVWSIRLPADVVRGGRLHLARQLRGRKGEDMIRLRSGETLYGTLVTPKIRLRASYGGLEFGAPVVASMRFADLQRGTVKVVLLNGDTFSGILENDDLAVDTASGRRSFRNEKIEAVGFRVRRDAPRIPEAPARFTMKNGDSFAAQITSPALRIRVGTQGVELPVADLRRVDLGDDTERTRVVTRKGDTLTGTLQSGLLEVDLALGGRIELAPAHVRTLVLSGP